MAPVEVSLKRFSATTISICFADCASVTIDVLIKAPFMCRRCRYTDPHVYDGPPSTEESGGLQTGEEESILNNTVSSLCVRALVKILNLGQAAGLHSTPVVPTP